MGKYVLVTYEYDFLDNQTYLLKVTDYEVIPHYDGKEEWVSLNGYIIWARDKNIDLEIYYGNHIQNLVQYDSFRIVSEEELLNRFIPDVM